MPRKTCLIPTCRSNPGDKRFIRVPRNEKLRETWKKLLLPYASYLSDVSSENFRSRYVCESHFEKKYFNEALSLKQKRCPTLFTDVEIATGIPSRTIEECQGDVLFEHAYVNGTCYDHTYAKNWHIDIEPELKKLKHLQDVSAHKEEVILKSLDSMDGELTNLKDIKTKFGISNLSIDNKPAINRVKMCLSHNSDSSTKGKIGHRMQYNLDVKPKDMNEILAKEECAGRNEQVNAAIGEKRKTKISPKDFNGDPSMVECSIAKKKMRISPKDGHKMMESRYSMGPSTRTKRINIIDSNQNTKDIIANDAWHTKGSQLKKQQKMCKKENLIKLQKKSMSLSETDFDQNWLSELVLSSSSPPPRGTTDYGQRTQPYLSASITALPRVDLNEQDAKNIHNQIKEAIFDACLRPCKPGRIAYAPAFESTPFLSQGALKLWCQDERALQWLVETVPNLKSPRKGTKLIVTAQDDIPIMLNAVLFVSDFDGEVGELHQVLSLQNPWYSMSTWVLHSCQKMTGIQSGMLLVYGIPREQIPSILERDRKIAFSTGSIHMRFFIDEVLVNLPHEGSVNIQDIDIGYIDLENDSLPLQPLSTASVSCISNALYNIDSNPVSEPCFKTLTPPWEILVEENVPAATPNADTFLFS